MSLIVLQMKAVPGSQILGTLRSNDATATRMSFKKRICVLSVFIAIISTHLLCQMQANPTGAEYLGTISKFRKRNKNFVVACLRTP